MALLMCGADCLGSLGPWRDPFGQGSLRSPKQIKRKYFQILYWNIICYYSAGQPIKLLRRAGWILGPCGATPLRDCFLHFFNTDFNKENDAFCDCNFPENMTSQKMLSRFSLITFNVHLISFNCPLISFNFLLCPLIFILFHLVFISFHLFVLSHFL